MQRTVAELKATLAWVEFLDWQAYFEMHPFGAEWDDMRMAVLSANIVAALTGKRQEVKKHLASYGRQASRKQSPQQQRMILEDYVARSKAWQSQTQRM